MARVITTKAVVFNAIFVTMTEVHRGSFRKHPATVREKVASVNGAHGK